MYIFWIWPFPRAVSARTARGDKYGRKFLKCFKWPDSYSPLIVKWFWAFYNFDARVRARHDLYVTFDDMTCWPLTWSICDMNMNDLWWRIMKIWWIMWFHKMAPGWRHDNLMTLKMFLSRLIIITYDCVKIEGNWVDGYWEIGCTKKWRNK